MEAFVPPSGEQAASLVPGPDSVTWRFAADARILVAAGYALVLQVAHPTVAAGVREHSDYANDPWGRLLRTLDYTNLMIYGGAEAAAITARRLRAMHAHIEGTTPDGHSYAALEPEAFAWVHATLVESIVSGHRHFGCSLGPDEIEMLYAQWRAMGRLIGIGAKDLPAGWAGFRDYFDAMVEERLEDSDVVHGVLASLTRPKPPPIPLLTEWAWRIGRIPIARLFSLATVGLLPAALRERCGLSWSGAEAAQLYAIGAVSRSVTPIMPKLMAAYGPGYLRWRRLALAET
jgi:uncharacterized protein (DUF2236 family)